MGDIFSLLELESQAASSCHMTLFPHLLPRFGGLDCHHHHHHLQVHFPAPQPKCPATCASQTLPRGRCRVESVRSITATPVAMGTASGGSITAAPSALWPGARRVCPRATRWSTRRRPSNPVQSCGSAVGSARNRSVRGAPVSCCPTPSVPIGWAVDRAREHAPLALGLAPSPPSAGLAQHMTPQKGDPGLRPGLKWGMSRNALSSALRCT